MLLNKIHTFTWCKLTRESKRQQKWKKELGNRWWGEIEVRLCSKWGSQQEDDYHQPGLMKIMLRTNVMSSIRKSETRSGLQARCSSHDQNTHLILSRQHPDTITIFPQLAPDLIPDQQLFLQNGRGFALFLRSHCSTGRWRAATETWTDVGCICILSHAKLRLILKEFSGTHQQNQVNTHRVYPQSLYICASFLSPTFTRLTGLAMLMEMLINYPDYITTSSI